MSLEELVEPVAADDDFGLVGHLAAIERMHQEALAQLDALARPWADDLWSAPAALTSTETEELPVVAPRLIHGAHAEAA